MSGEIICSVFHVPGYKVGVGPTPTYQNAEVLNQIYYSDCIQVQIEGIEALIDEGLGIEAAGYCVEFELDDLLRMDSATKIKMLGEAVGGAIMSPNEARNRLNLASVDGGDTPYLQQQNYSLAALNKRDTQADPFGTSQPADQQMREIQQRARVQVETEMREQRENEARALKDFSDFLVSRLADET
jgi:phage portal protein BeeE